MIRSWWTEDPEPLTATSSDCLTHLYRQIDGINKNGLFSSHSGPEVSVAKGSVFRGWGGKVDGDENATLDHHRETAAGESGADEIEQGFPCPVRR